MRMIWPEPVTVAPATPIRRAVIHAAGILTDNLIQIKSKAEADKVILPKVKGALVLNAALQDTPLDFLAMCSSVSSLLGLPGQIDYTAANAFLDAFASWRTSHEGARTISINWSAWKQIGMLSAIAEHPKTAEAQSNEPALRGSHYPFWDGFYGNANHDFVFKMVYSREKQWLLSEHVVRGGNSLIPGTGFLELIRAAWTEAPQTDGSMARWIELRVEALDS